MCTKINGTLSSMDPQGNTVLILTSPGNHMYIPSVIKDGVETEPGCFVKDSMFNAGSEDKKMSLHDSCPINWKNTLHIFGGSGQHNAQDPSYFSDSRQIIRLTGKKLERIGSLTFIHIEGSYSLVGNEIVLCFNRLDPNCLSSDQTNCDSRRCRKSAGPLEEFSEIKLSNHDHRSIKTSSSESKFTDSIVDVV